MCYTLLILGDGSREPEEGGPGNSSRNVGVANVIEKQGCRKGRQRVTQKRNLRSESLPHLETPGLPGNLERGHLCLGTE